MPYIFLFRKKWIVWTITTTLILTALGLFLPFEGTPSIALQRTEPVKTRSTFYTPEKVQAARNNIAEYAWAKTKRNEAVAEADQYIRMGHTLLWNSITPQTIPRSYAVNQDAGSPVTGNKIDQYGAYPYKFNVAKDPWKLTDPSSSYKFPTNDYGAFYKSGLNAHGIFDPNLADRSLLVNTLYPEKGAGWGVDDGTGWTDSSGNKFTFIAYYNHWAIWRDLVSKAMQSLRNAYLYTGDTKYSDAGIIMLHRIADIYPAMDVGAYDWDDGFRNSHELTGQGKILGSVWEAPLIRDIISCYDAFFPAMQDDDTEWVRFLQAQRNLYPSDDDQLSARSIRKHIEDGILRQIYPAVQKAQIYGNVGFHQSSLAMAAVVLDDPAVSKEWIDFLFRTGGLVEDRKGIRVTGGNLHQVLASEVDRDGFGNEASPEYNSYWLDNLRQVADILQNYDRYPEADLYQNTKFRKMFAAFIPLTLSGKYAPSIGDSGTTGKPGIWLNQRVLIKGFEAYKDPLLAQAAVFANKNSTAGLVEDIFSPNPGATTQAIKEVIQAQGTLQLESTNLSGYGLAVLRDGKTKTADEMKRDNNQRDLWMYYGRNATSHAHRDSLNLGLHAFGLDLMPDMGFVSFADNNSLLQFWERNTISHNTVVVDKQMQAKSWVGRPLHVDSKQQIQLIDVEAPYAYPETELYRRTSALIRVDDINSYAVDFFRVKGGTDHHFSFHGAEGTVTTEGLQFKAQSGGTYAGKSVPYASEDYNAKSTSGFNYLTNVKTATNPPSTFSLDWKVKDTWKALPSPDNIHLRLTMLGELNDITLADGKPPQNKPGNPPSLNYVVAHRTGTNLNSTFTSVLEPYRGERFIQSIVEVPVAFQGKPITNGEVKAVKVTLKTGRVDYIVSALDTGKLYSIDSHIQFQGAIGYYSEQDHKPLYAYVQEGTTIGKPNSPSIIGAIPRMEGLVRDWSGGFSSSNRIDVEWSGLNPLTTDPARIEQELKNLIGRSIMINRRDYAADSPNTVFEIKGIEVLSPGKARIDFGDTSIVRGWKDPNDFSKGYNYLVAEGNLFTIPLSIERNYNE